MEAEKSTFIDNILAILFLLVLPFASLFLLAIHSGLRLFFLVGWPFVAYGIIGLVRKRIWLCTFRGGPLLRVPKFYFVGEESKRISLMYIGVGLIISIVFFAINAILDYYIPIPEEFL